MKSGHLGRASKLTMHISPAQLLNCFKVSQVDVKVNNASHYFSKYGFISPKHLRKFAFDKMIELEIPESVADFIEGRVPRQIGAKHYMVLRRQAVRFYIRYARYLRKLRKKFF